MREARRNLLVVGGGVAAVGLACWGWQAAMSWQMEVLSSSAPLWTPLAVAATFVTWCVMMTAMMLPTAVPFVRTYWTLAGSRTVGGSRSGATFAFVAGYLVSWAGFSAAATALQILLDQSGLLSPTMAISHGAVSGMVALFAGIYQFTPMKLVCANKCRTPIGFFVARWRDGARGAMAIGIAHGVYCVGCCWMLMVTMFAAGIMSLAWMAALTAIVLVEKLPAVGERFGRAIGWIGIAAGIGLIAWSVQA